MNHETRKYCNDQPVVVSVNVKMNAAKLILKITQKGGHPRS